ncbi:MAG: methyltransferase domain-containing protein [Bacteroidales bacterium]|nr:methyltransferase domain-containing protein [Bacteroidales bacterium]
MAETERSSDLECFKAELSQSDFKAFSDYIYSEFGIKMPDIKRVMLQGRLLKRVRELKMSSYAEYKNYFFSEEGQRNELYNFLSVVTTNKTDFFRESVHFDFLSQEVLPGFMAEGRTNIKVWSAACSSGEEPYTISIVLNEFKERNPMFNFSILGTDISSNVLDKAVKGVYPEKTVEVIPLHLKKKYFLRSKDRVNPTVRVTPQLQQNISLKYLNLMDTVYDITDKYDVIFCRNVLIYFDRETQEKVVTKLCRHLAPGGYLMIGHSESIANMDLPLKNIKPTMFKRI